MQNTDKTSPEEVREAMDKLGWDVDDTANATGMHKNSIWNWLRFGGTPLIRAFFREALARRKIK